AIPSGQVVTSYLTWPYSMTVAITPDGSLGFALGQNTSAQPDAPGGGITVIDMSTQHAEFPPQITVSTGWGCLAVTPDGQTLVVIDSGGASSALIDIPSRSVTVSGIATGDYSYPAVLTPDGTLAFVPNLGSSLVAIELPSGNVAATFPVEAGPTSVAITPD